MAYHNGKQNGFIEHNGYNIDKVLHNGNCVFNQGFDRDNSGTDSVTLDGTIGKDLMDWSIVGNTYQASIPSPSSPVSVLGVGDRTGNLLQLTSFNYGKNTGTGYMGVDVFESDGYTIIVKGHSNTGGGRTNRCSKPFILTAGEYTLSATRDISGLLPFIQNSQNNAILGQLGSFTIESDVEVYLGFNVSNGADYDFTFSLMLNEGSEPLSFEPFGYKIPVVSKSENEITIIGIQPTTNYAYFNRNVMPNVKVGDGVMVYINNNSYKLNVMQIDDNYIYIENKVV